jgi:hypothetical protein
MKILNPRDDLQSFEKVFKQLKTSKSQLVIWQVFPENGKRVVHHTVLNSYDFAGQLLNLSSVNDFLDPALPLFCYVEDQALIFKSNVREIKDDSFTTLFPSVIKQLEEGDFETIKSQLGIDTQNLWIGRGRTEKIEEEAWHVKSMSERSSRDQDFLNTEFGDLTLDEEDKMFAGKRESPRVRPKAQKLVKVVKKGETLMNLFDLFDLSRGGMSFVTSIPDNFPKGSEIMIVGFDTFDLDDPLLGTVMSHRAIPESALDYKVGVKFLEGQE